MLISVQSIFISRCLDFKSWPFRLLFCAVPFTNKVWGVGGGRGGGGGRSVRVVVEQSTGRI